MKILLDTHAVLWAFGDPDHLSEPARKHYLDTDHIIWQPFLTNPAALEPIQT